MSDFYDFILWVIRVLFVKEEIEYENVFLWLYDGMRFINIFNVI